MHNHDNVSIPKNGFNTKYTITATIQANIEKINCLNDKPKNILSVKSLYLFLLPVYLASLPLFLSAIIWSAIFKYIEAIPLYLPY